MGALDWINGITIGVDVVDNAKEGMGRHDVEKRTGDAMDVEGTKLNSVGANTKDKAEAEDQGRSLAAGDKET